MIGYEVLKNEKWMKNIDARYNRLFITLFFLSTKNGHDKIEYNGKGARDLENKTKDQKEQKQEFAYRAQTSRYAFPLDIPVSKVAEDWEIDARTIRAYVTDNPLFAEFYQYMRYDGNVSKKRGKDHKVFNGIPVELEKFFSVYFISAYDHQEKRMLKEGTLPDGFEESLCLRFHRQAMGLEKSQDQTNLYLYRRLYDNEAFRSAILEKYWNVLRKRWGLYEDLMLQMDTDTQLEQMKEMITYLDLKMAHYARKVKKKKQGKQMLSFIKSFPSEVLDYIRRRKDVQKDQLDETAKFRLPKLIIEREGQAVMPLKEALDEVVHSRNGAAVIIDKARKTYMDYVRMQCIKTEFQSQCEELQKYLDEFEEEISDDELNKEIKVVCAELFSSIPAGNPFSSGVYYNGGKLNRQKGEKHRFIIDTATYLYSNFAYEYQQFLRCLEPSDYKRDKFFFEENKGARQRYIKENNLDAECFCRELANSHMDTIRELWVADYLGDFSVFQNALEKNIEEISVKMQMICANAYEGLGLTIPYWTDNLYIWQGWLRYKRINDKNGTDLSTVCIDPCDVILIRALFMCRLWYEYRKSQGIILDNFKQLSVYLQNAD